MYGVLDNIVLNLERKCNNEHQFTTIMLTFSRAIGFRDVQKVFGHCDFLLYISYKTTFLKNIIPSRLLFDFDDFFTNKNRIKFSFTL